MINSDFQMKVSLSSFSVVGVTNGWRKAKVGSNNLRSRMHSRDNTVSTQEYLKYTGVRNPHIVQKTIPHLTTNFESGLAKKKYMTKRFKKLLFIRQVGPGPI
jgi:hypothetical protein